MAYLAKRKKVYYVREKIKVDGIWKTKWIKLGEIPYAKAKEVLRKFESDETYLRLDIDSGYKMKFKNLVEEFLDWEAKFTDKKEYTISRDRIHLNQACKVFGEEYIHKFNPEKFTEWVTDLKLKPKTVWHYAGAIKIMFKYAVTKGYLKKNLADQIRKPRLISAAPKFVPEEILWTVFDCISKDRKPPFQIMLYSGLRPAECLRLKAKNVDLKKNVLDLYADQTKTAERGIIPIHNDLKHVLERLIKGKKPEDYLFPSEHGQGHQQECKKSLQEACKRATNLLQEKAKKKKDKDWKNIKVHITPYQLRHTFATRILEKTGDIRIVQQLMRHKNISMTTRYATALDYKLREAIDISF